MSPQPPGSPDSGRPRSPLRDRTPVSSVENFRARLDSRQVEGELDAIFRESPEFGRNLAFRLEPFLGEETDGTLSLFEALFSSGITIDSIGKNDSFLLFRQPFIGGRHPTETELHDHMRDLGWAPLNAPCIGDTLKKLTWQKGRFLATDVRSENAIVSATTGTIHPIDFIVDGYDTL